MRKKYILKNRKRFAFCIILIAFTALTSLYAVGACGHKEPSYELITVKYGDTLWDIAKKYNPNGDVREYIYKIKKINGLSDSTIYPGSEIKLP